MNVRLVLVAMVSSAIGVFAANELPAPDENEPLEIEPPILIHNRDREGPLPDAQPNAPGAVDVAKLEADLARAKKNAASGDRLYKAGIIAKVEAEDRALKVERLEDAVAQAQLADAKAKLDELKSGNGADESSARELKAAETVVADANAAAERAAAARRAAEVEAAARNVERQRKLLALGSGHKSDVNRAQEKLAELQQPKQ